MNQKLRQVITTPMRTILAVRACFDYCENVEDVEQVIKKIPPKFGKFELLAVYENEKYFQIQNFFEKGGELHSQIVSHDFYNVKEDYYYDFGRKA
jgi:hypothetical protein